MRLTIGNIHDYCEDYVYSSLCEKDCYGNTYLNLIPQLGGQSVEGTWCIRCKLASIFFNFLTNNTNPKLELLQTRNWSKIMEIIISKINVILEIFKCNEQEYSTVVQLINLIFWSNLLLTSDFGGHARF